MQSKDKYRKTQIIVNILWFGLMFGLLSLVIFAPVMRGEPPRINEQPRIERTESVCHSEIEVIEGKEEEISICHDEVFTD